MSPKSKSLTSKVWISFIIFSVTILAFLWLFQVIFLDTYYENSKRIALSEVANQIKSNYENDDLENILDNLAFERGVCIELLEQNHSIYLSNNFDIGCLDGKYNNSNLSYKQQFILSGEESAHYTIINPRFQNKALLYALKLNSSLYVFVSASIEPMDATTKILSSQLVIVTILVLLLSCIIAYFISKKISAPIVAMNEQASKMGKGNYQVSFDTHSEISELNELAHTLNLAKEELSKTDELRRDLMANVSHDLKTPLTMIKAYACMAQDLNSENPEKRNANLEVIIEETDRLNHLVNDILELSKLQSSITTLDIEVFDLHQLILSILKRYNVLKETEGYHFIYENTRSIYVKADKKRMEQVIYNLINNAVHYTGRDNTVTIILEEKDTYVIVKIKDTGNGIKPEDLPYIWDKYYKNNKKHKRNLVGTGLGLSIVKNILENHHSHYGVESKKGKGTTFYFDIKKEV